MALRLAAPTTPSPSDYVALPILRPVTPVSFPTDASAAAICSELVEYRNAAGLRINAYFDHKPNGPAARKFAVMAPKYGETKKNNLQLAYELVANGMSVLRFDLTNHIGESEGNMPDFSLTGAVSDIIASVEYLERKHGANDIIIVATSLSARCAMRAAALTPRLTRLVCMVGVVNLQHTIFEVYKEDIFGTYMAGRRWGLTDILGFNINAEHFMQTAIDADLHNLGGTVRDLDRMKVPVDYFYAENDAWVKFEEVMTIFRDRPNCRLHPVKGAMHELRENPKAADRVYRSVVARCIDGSADETQIVAAPLKAVLEQNRVERNRLKKFAPNADDEKGFGAATSTSTRCWSTRRRTRSTSISWARCSAPFPPATASWMQAVATDCSVHGSSVTSPADKAGARTTCPASTWAWI